MVEPPKTQEVRMEPIKSAPRPDNSPPALDVKGQGPGDAFGLEGHPGGGDFLGGGGGGGGSPFGAYTGLFEGRARDALQKQRKLLGFRYRVPVEVWLSADGAPERVELLGSTGNPETDSLVREGLLKMNKMPEPPPKGMPEPIVIQVSSS